MRDLCMPFAAALSTSSHATQAAEEVALAAGQGLGRPADLAVAFYSPHHAADAADLAGVLHERLGPRALVGVLGESIIGGAREVENRPAVSLWLGAWGGGTEVDAFHLDLEQTPDGPTLFGWPEGVLGAEGRTSMAV